jgi:hypothetical protein
MRCETNATAAENRLDDIPGLRGIAKQKTRKERGSAANEQKNER